MTATEKLTSTDGALLSSEDETKYRSIVGGLEYIILTHPDLSFGKNVLDGRIVHGRCHFFDVASDF
jgi:hypothetical protein